MLNSETLAGVTALLDGSVDSYLIPLTLNADAGETEGDVLEYLSEADQEDLIEVERKTDGVLLTRKGKRS